MNAGEQISLSDLGLWYGKMSRELSVPITEKILESSSKKRQGSSTVTPQFLDLRTDRPGAILGAFWEMDGLSLGEYMTHSFGESPKDGVECRLSQILEDNPHPRYCLSGRACQGILNRAKKRGKALPRIFNKHCNTDWNTSPLPYGVSCPKACTSPTAPPCGNVDRPPCL